MKNNTILLLLLLVLLTIGGCKKETTPPTTVTGGPSLTTADATLITSNSAQLGGNITSEGACTILTSGVVAATSPNPTLNNLAFANTGTQGTGNFSVSATGLLPATTYYARAYAANCKGVNYGNEIQFTTLGGGGGGGGGRDTTYYLQLNYRGKTYICAGYGSDSIIEADGNRGASCGLFNGVFEVSGSASHYIDNAQSNGFSFGMTCTGISNTGTYTFTQATSDPKNVSMGIRIAPGVSCSVSTPFTTRTIELYDTNMNEARHKDANDNCITTTLTVATQTLVITEWGNNALDVISGTFSGTMYENSQTLVNCTDSEANTFTGSFHLKRIQ